MTALRTKRAAGKLILLLGSVTFSFLATEALLRYFDLADPPLYEADPDYGYLMQPGQSASTRGHRFHINNLGLRGSDVRLPKPSQVFRIVFLGDSITYGGGRVPDGELFVNRIATALTACASQTIESINLSAPGWGIGNIAAYERKHGLHEADAVVWVVPTIDFRRPKTSLKKNNFPTKKPWSRFGYSLTVLNRSLWGLSGRKRPDCSKGLPTLTDNLAGFSDTLQHVKERNAFGLAITIPYGSGYGCQLEDRDRFRSAASVLGVTFLDAYPTFEEYETEKLFIDGVHLNRMGHQVVAEIVVPMLWKEWLSSRIDGSPSLCLP